jgi:hypothetical protein
MDLHGHAHARCLCMLVYVNMFVHLGACMLCFGMSVYFISIRISLCMHIFAGARLRACACICA